MEKFHSKLRPHTETAKKRKARQEGLVCMPGIGMEGGVIITKEEARQNKRAKTAQEDEVTRDENNKCDRCGEHGHKRMTNKKCKHHKAPQPKDTSTTADDTCERDGAQQELLDELPLLDDGDEFFVSFEQTEDRDNDSEFGLL